MSSSFRFNFGGGTAAAKAPTTEDAPSAVEEKFETTSEELSLSDTEASSESLNFDTVFFGDGEDDMLFKRIVSPQEASIADPSMRSIVKKTDVERGLYEGGLKHWECSTDLLYYLRDSKIDLENKRVLELGCGHALPAVYCAVKGASSVVLQDLNAFVLRSVAAPNVAHNAGYFSSRASHETGVPADFEEDEDDEDEDEDEESENKEVDNEQENEQNNEQQNSPGEDSNAGNLPSSSSPPNRTADSREGERLSSSSFRAKFRYFAGDWRDPKLVALLKQCAPFDYILTSDTIYSPELSPVLIDLISALLKPDTGRAFVAAKRFYFGVGGSTQHFMDVAEKRTSPAVECSVVREFADGSSNIREVLSCRISK